MGNKLIIQLVLIAVSLAIIFTFIKPSFGEIKQKQDELEAYSGTIAHAAALNARLQELVQVEQSFSQSDMQALERFLPSHIDEVLIMKDVQSIFEESDAELISVTSGEVTQAIDDVVFEMENVETQSEDVDTLDLSVSFRGTYEEMKDVLRKIEMNAYILEVTSLEFSVASESELEASGVDQQGNITYELTLRAYGLTNVVN